ncbi:unnamed protein product [Lymnaea stagnalis]|uniref:Lipocalin/cytosolic fatty-acid binding domain-containing protein n=1 Tax=Lymnaea stagnalis TaxID=6523 RepID=A0AAV2HXP9_LYMST
MEGDLLGFGFDPTPQTTAPANLQVSPPSQISPQAGFSPPAPAPVQAAPTVPAIPAQTQQSQSPPPQSAPTVQQTPAAVSAPPTTSSGSPPPTAAPSSAKPTMFVLKEEEPGSPVLKEIQAKFGGRWKLARSDSYDEYLKAAGVGIFHRKIASSGTPEQVFSVKGDKIYVSFHSTFHNQNYVFQLDQAVENLVEKTRQSVFTSYRDGKLILEMTPLEVGWDKPQEVERHINDMGEHVVIYTCGSVSCRRYFARLPDLPVIPNVVA